MTKAYKRGGHRDKENKTSTPSKYPQGYFKDKPCKKCGEAFSPTAPSEKYCSNACGSWVFDDNYLRKSYGIGKDDYDKMYIDQKGVCLLCNEEGFSMHKNSKDSVKLVVDHDHNTGRVRGLLCHNCNRGLGLFKDDVVRITKVLEYLK